MSQAVYSWFWQPPLDGRPGLMMIVDEHPGPERPDIQMVLEDLPAVLMEIDKALPKDIHFHQLGIFHCDVLGNWSEINFKSFMDPRRYRVQAPAISQGDLQQLWESRL